MFDLKTFKTLGKIPAAEDADAILYDSASNRVFTLNGDAHSSTVIDPAGTLITNIPLGGNPVAPPQRQECTRTSPTRARLLRSTQSDCGPALVTAPCKQPVAMAIDTTHQRLFSGCRSESWRFPIIRRNKGGGFVPIGRASTALVTMLAPAARVLHQCRWNADRVHQDTADQYHVVENVCRRDRAIWASIPPITAFSSCPQSSGQRLRWRRTCAAQGRSHS
jgi:hypothetical protein